MTGRSRVKVFVVLAIATAICVAPALAQTPKGVSPGAVDRMDGVEGRCPTFIWVGVSEAQFYELVVYRLPDEPQASGTAEIDLSASDQVLYSRVPGGAAAWQPRLADSLDPGGSYVWFVRAVLLEEAGEIVDASDWSAARFFSIPATPSPMDVEGALDVLRRYTEMSGARVDEFDQPQSEIRSTGSDRAAHQRRAATPPESLKSVPTATAAIKGTIPDATGETYGVVGISNSPDGAGVAAANSAGGPDLVLDGTEDGETDLELYQWGIDRASAGIETFQLTNSNGGSMDLWVQGNVDAVALIGDGAQVTNVDADTLDGTDGADFATDLEAAGLVAAHAASADHDGRYYTETELNSRGGGGAVHWDNLTEVPGGFADGVDDDTQYSVGPGLIIDGDQIRIDWGLFQTRASTLDNGLNVGYFTSIATGADELGLISYFDANDFDLKVAHCTNTACSSATTATLDSVGTVGQYTSIAIGADGLGLISYLDSSNYDLKVAHCTNTACSSATTATLDNAGNLGSHTSIAIGTDGLGLISYFDATNANLKVAHCANTACSSATTRSTLDSGGTVGQYTSIAIGADGLGLISYYDVTNANLKVAHCANAACTSATTTTLDSVDYVGQYTSIAIGADGLGLISYYDVTNANLKVAHCANTACTSATTATLDSVGTVGQYTSIAIGADSLGLISYFDSVPTFDLKVAHCSNTACTSATTATLDSSGLVGLYTSITIGADGLGLVSYQDDSNLHLKVAHLGIGVP